jgi:hypothetical protein
MLTSATDFDHHFSGLVASLSLYESGKFDILGITPKAETLERPGSAAELAEAFRRGSACSGDFSVIDISGAPPIRSKPCASGVVFRPARPEPRRLSSQPPRRQRRKRRA